MVEQAKVSIGVASRLTGITAKTLRMWERRYQIGASARSVGGQRKYSTTEIDHLKLIKQLINNGMRIGEIAKLSTKALTCLLLESGQHDVPNGVAKQALRTLAVGAGLCTYFQQHLKRYPQLALTFSQNTSLNAINTSDNRLAILEISAINKHHIEALLTLRAKKVHVVVLYIFSNQQNLAKLEKEGVIPVKGTVEASRIDAAVNKVLERHNSLSALHRSSREFGVTLPTCRPRQFDETALLEAEAQSDKLNCECPPHLSDLIRRLNAFEDYSQNCGAENWKEVAVHACVFAYANQARYLMEKALNAVLDE